MLDTERAAVKKAAGKDPLGRQSSRKIGKHKLAELLTRGDPRAAGIVTGAIEDFAAALYKVIKRYLRLRAYCFPPLQ